MYIRRPKRKYRPAASPPAQRRYQHLTDDQLREQCRLACLEFYDWRSIAHRRADHAWKLAHALAIEGAARGWPEDWWRTVEAEAIEVRRLRLSPASRRSSIGAPTAFDPNRDADPAVNPP